MEPVFFSLKDLSTQHQVCALHAPCSLVTGREAQSLFKVGGWAVCVYNLGV